MVFVPTLTMLDGPPGRSDTVVKITYYTGSTAWNSLSDDLRDPTLSTDSFRRPLKTRLFSAYILVHTAHGRYRTSCAI